MTIQIIYYQVTTIFQGIDMLEKHFTILDKEETRDGKVSVTPDELQELHKFSNYTKESVFGIEWI